MKLTRITVKMDEELIEQLQELPNPSGNQKPNVSYHIREAVRLYLSVLKTENKEIFESKLEAMQGNTCN